jgi:hypothetical protein
MVGADVKPQLSCLVAAVIKPKGFFFGAWVLLRAYYVRVRVRVCVCVCVWMCV